MNLRVLSISLLSVFSLSVNASELSPIAALGQKLFFDNNLSEPAGQACASCHLPTAGFADPDQEIPVSRGVFPERFASRNTPTLSYAMYSPELTFDEEEKHYFGGYFLDGRSNSLEEQAEGPLLNPVEMANIDAARVVGKVEASPYANEFREVFGKEVFKDKDRAFKNITLAIAAFERTSVFQPFTSKYDYYLAGKVELTKQEQLGLDLFEAEDKGNCAACHPSKPKMGVPALFTDFTYDNIGLPKNTSSPFYSQSKQFNPEQDKHIDIGLSKTTGRDADRGKFKVNTLRNIELTPPYMHNGVLKTLRDTVDFYNTRDTRNDWGQPEVKENLNTDELGNLGLNNKEVDAIVAFMKTLTDGYDINSQ